jgi:F0F1-type ATP synthase assembly protein I
MFKPPHDSREFGQYVVLAQVGMEMVAPIGLGWAVDYFFDCSPWGIVGGAVFGFVGGLAHLLTLRKQQGSGTSRPRAEDS